MKSVHSGYRNERPTTQSLCAVFSAAAMYVALATSSVAYPGNTPAADTPADSIVHIDRLIRQSWKDAEIAPAAKCTDRVFVRRVYLDLAGRVPTTAEVHTFLSDERTDKRRHLIDLLLESEDQLQHFTDLFDTLLMGRADEEQYAERTQYGWRSYLESWLRDDRPWNAVARQILLARPETESERGAVWFLYERDNEHQEIAEAVAPAFFGIRVECAQCHDHMVVDEIKQEHYWGLVAFFNRGKNKMTSNGPRVVESSIGGFSEFADLEGGTHPNLLSFLNAAVVDEQRPEKDTKQEDTEELYIAASITGEPRVPKFSRRLRFVDDVVDGHPMLARSMVNRLWAFLLGRGIVHPYDEMDSVHPPSHPELLDWLSADFEAHGYRIRRTLRLIANSEAYQLAALRPDGVDDPATFAWYLERPLTAEQMARSVQLVLRGEFENDSPLVSSFRQQFLDVLPDETVVTIGDALYLSNNREFDSFLAGSDQQDHLIGRLMTLPTDRERVDLIFETILSRSPDEDEAATIVAYLQQRQNSTITALQHVVWSLLTSAEFRFNH